MATRQVTIVLDDLTGRELPSEEAETVRFGLDGVHYEIDVDASGAEALRAALAPYVSAGRRLVGARGDRPVHRVSTVPDPAAVRAWASAHGIHVNARGRIPGRVVEQFREAGN